MIFRNRFSMMKVMWDGMVLPIFIKPQNMKNGQNGLEAVAGMIWLYYMKLKQKNGSLCTKSGKKVFSFGNL